MLLIIVINSRDMGEGVGEILGVGVVVVFVSVVGVGSAVGVRENWRIARKMYGRYRDVLKEGDNKQEV